MPWTLRSRFIFIKEHSFLRRHKLRSVASVFGESSLISLPLLSPRKLRSLSRGPRKGGLAGPHKDLGKQKPPEYLRRLLL